MRQDNRRGLGDRDSQLPSVPPVVGAALRAMFGQFVTKHLIVDLARSYDNLASGTMLAIVKTSRCEEWIRQVIFPGWCNCGISERAACNNSVAIIIDDKT